MARSPSAPTPSTATDSPSPGVTARHGAHDDGQRLGQHQLVVADLGGRRPAAARRQAGLLGEAAVDVDADGGAREAEIAIAFAAERADAAGVVGLDRDLLAGPERLNIGTDRDDLADELVTHDERVLHGAIAVPDAVVGAAETRGGDLDHGLGGSGSEEGPRLHPDITGPVKHGSAHGAHPTDCPSARQGKTNRYAALWPPSRNTVWPVM